MPLRLLLVVSRHPLPARRGDQRRALQALEALALRHGVSVLAPAPPADLPAADRQRLESLPVDWVPYREAGPLGRLRALAGAAASGMPLQCGLFGSPDLGTELARLVPEADLVILQLVRLAPWLDRLEGCPVVVDLIDSLALSTARRAELDRAWLAPALRLEAGRLGRWEGRLADRAARTLVVSERDRRAVAEVSPRAAQRVRVLPVAVPDTPGGREERDGGPRTLVVTGNLGYFPTREGLRWFLDDIWPRLAREDPDLRLVLAGTRAPAWLERRAARTPGVTLLADPPDLASVLRGARIALAPMRGGAGQPLKVCEAWAAGVPVVATPWAAAGTTGRPGEELVVADGADAWVAAIRGLLGDPERARRIAEAAGRRVALDYSPGSVSKGWLEVVEEAVFDFDAREAREARSRA